jgi:hypothetical protein
VTEWISDSRAETFANWLLSNVPGLPPILQTFHLLSVAAIMASAVFINLRALEWAVPTQRPEEMLQRLQAWTWYGLLGVFSSGIWFVLARPNRYFSNPVFQIKFALLLLAVIATFALNRLTLGQAVPGAASRDRQWLLKCLAFLSLLLWIGVVLAGRWIAYVEYLFWQG